jgi:predicted transposase YbfD/YdcC
MRCQTDIAENIIEKQADYVLAVKNNKKFLHDAITDYFEVAIPANDPESC